MYFGTHPRSSRLVAVLNLHGRNNEASFPDTYFESTSEAAAVNLLFLGGAEAVSENQRCGFWLKRRL